MTSHPSTDTSLLLAALVLLVAAAALPSTAALHLDGGSSGPGVVGPALLFATPCPQHLSTTEGQRDLLQS